VSKLIVCPLKINKRILVAPLDWGLGHATRSIPVVRMLQKLGCEVWIATSGKQEILLREECPDARFLYLPGYGVQYGRRGVMLRLLRQIPVIRRHIFTEHAWLQQAIREHEIDGVISDNRYGLYSKEVPSVLITHQLALQMPGWAKFLFRSGVQQMLYDHIEHFSECWVPDLAEKEPSLAGDMSHPDVLPNLPVRYIGWLSRFKTPENPPDKEDAVLISISGPEPQRGLLEEMVLKQIPGMKGKCWLVRGIPGNGEMPGVPGNVTVYNHVPAQKMQELMLRCSLLVSRSGYSTLMDALVLGTPIACIPTPGQTEQEYLSKRLAGKQWSASMKQEHFNLAELISKAKGMHELPAATFDQTLLESVISDWVASL
jgi:uncharacterized protein (TIGR00661 family)